ncbi:MAG: DUF962 domain-containing protein [Chitinophagales bacterium]
MAEERKYNSFWSFYPYYLTEHARPINRTLHFIGTAGVISLAIAAIVTQKWVLFAFLPLCGYGFAWFGHFMLEKNRPATFKYPFYSLGSDFVMFWHILTGQIGKKVEEAHRTIGVENKWK